LARWLERIRGFVLSRRSGLARRLGCADCPRGAHHDGIYLGNGYVIYLTAPLGAGKVGAHVQTDTLAAFAADRPVTVQPYADNHDPDAIIAWAISRLGQGGYHLIFNNCQHFAR
jgi:hypothetical protein